MISELEGRGLIQSLQTDRQLVRDLEEDHLRYQKMRFDLLKKLHPGWARLPASKLSTLTRTGIGGIRDFAHLKCLHLHYAHFLADDNCVGRRVHRLLKEQNP